MLLYYYRNSVSFLPVYVLSCRLLVRFNWLRETGSFKQLKKDRQEGLLIDQTIADTLGEATQRAGDALGERTRQTRVCWKITMWLMKGKINLQGIFQQERKNITQQDIIHSVWLCLDICKRRCNVIICQFNVIICPRMSPFPSYNSRSRSSSTIALADPFVTRCVSPRIVEIRVVRAGFWTLYCVANFRTTLSISSTSIHWLAV